MWVFGLVDTSHTPAIRYMEVHVVTTQNAATLLPISKPTLHWVQFYIQMSGMHTREYHIYHMWRHMGQLTTL